MKTRSSFLVVLGAAVVLLAGVTFSRATITGISLAGDGDGVLTCNTYGFLTNGPGEFQMNIDGRHILQASGDILGPIYTDNLDPKLTLLHEIDNDTGFTWTDYHVVITMDQQFTISSVTVGQSWTADPAIQPTLVGSDWIGYVNFNAGTPITPAADPNNPLPANTLDFGYKLTFNGSPSGVVNYCETLTPSPIPEPGSLSLIGLAGLLFAIRRARQ